MSDPWFRFFPSDWLSGVSGLSAAERGVYVTVLALIYDHGGPLKRDDARLSRQCGLPKVGFIRALESLIETKKLFIQEDGCIFNNRAKSELSERENRKDTASKAATSRWDKNKQNQSEISAEALPEQCGNDATRAPIPQPQPQPQLDASTSLRSEEASAAAPARTRADFDRIENECRKAAGVENSPSPALAVLAPILGLLDAGFDLEGDILPAIRRKPYPKAGSWKWFLPQIQDYRAERLGALKTGRDAIAATAPKPKERISDDAWRARVKGWSDSGFRSSGWLPNWGPKPGRGGCEIPAHIVAEFPQLKAERAA